MSEHVTKFGQAIAVGDVVGWGHRNGNFSRQQVGIVLELADKPITSWQPDNTETRARCWWVAGAGSREDYASETSARDLFVLDPDTFDEVLRQKIALARRAQLPS